MTFTTNFNRVRHGASPRSFCLKAWAALWGKRVVTNQVCSALYNGEMTAIRHGLLLIGHGTRNLRGQQEFLELGQGVRDRLPQAIVEPVFLELVSPDVSAGFARLHDQGVTRVIVVPVLLFAAGHARRDIPEMCDTAARQYGFEQITQCEPLDCHAQVVALSNQRFEESLRERSTAQREGGVVRILVARGSKDADCTSNLQRFAAACDSRLRENPGVARTVESRFGFLAMAAPSLQETIEEVGGLGPCTVVVQPHLLFEGDLLVGLRETVGEAGSRFSCQHWQQTAHLGPDDAIKSALCDRFLQACAP